MKDQECECGEEDEDGVWRDWIWKRMKRKAQVTRR